jgi:hypothetical protein
MTMLSQMLNCHVTTPAYAQISLITGLRFDILERSLR